jgi:inward rectifier potassium channel
MTTRQPPEEEIEVVNAPKSFFGDLYHELLRSPWWATLLFIASLFLATNVVFATVYYFVGGIEKVRPGSYEDAFFFSVQTLATIGYGAMYPVTRAAHVVVTFESLAATIFVALSTGLVFSKFAMPTARIDFTDVITVSRVDGIPTLAFRVANRRGNFVMEATVRVSMFRTETTAEGVKMYRMYDLPLVRERTPALGRSWTVMHQIGPASLLNGATLQSMKRDEIEFVATVVGIDGDTMQTVHARHRWLEGSVRFGVRHADMLTELPDGRIRLDFSKFNDLVTAAV